MTLHFFFVKKVKIEIAIGLFLFEMLSEFVMDLGSELIEQRIMKRKKKLHDSIQCQK